MFAQNIRLTLHNVKASCDTMTLLFHKECNKPTQYM